MSPRQILLDLGRCLRAAAPPLLVLAAIPLTGTPRSEGPAGTNLEHLAVLAWPAAIVATSLWFLVAAAWAATRPWRDWRAFERLKRLRELATAPDRALVHVQTVLCSSTAGQYVVVVNVANGGTFRVWLPEATAPIGAFVVLERTDGGVTVVDWMNAHQVEPGHRHERRHPTHRVSNVEEHGHAAGYDDRDVARQLIEETEQFLRDQEYRW